MVNLGCHYYPKMWCVDVLQPPQTLKKNSISPSLPHDNNDYKDQPASSSSSGKISPAIVFIVFVIIIAVIFFISGVLHLLVRLLTKRGRSSTTTTTTTTTQRQQHEIPGSFQRQLQQLFHLHDSGLDQAFIDALPVFLYRDVMGLEEPFDCAVCLSEFSDRDSLRLLPLCSHAFHVGCIDTWLLSNSTCPLCRGTLQTPPGLLLPTENPVFYPGEDGCGSSGVASEIHERVFSVRLGKFRSTNAVGNGVVSKQEEEEEEEKGESSANASSCSLELDSRRCYSMGSYHYVVADSDLRVVALRPKRQQVLGNNNNNSLRVVKERSGGDSEGKKIINIGTKGDSFSVSKIWQWPRKGKPTPASSEEPHLPWNNMSQVS